MVKVIKADDVFAILDDEIGEANYNASNYMAAKKHTAYLEEMRIIGTLSAIAWDLKGKVHDVEDFIPKANVEIEWDKGAVIEEAEVEDQLTKAGCLVKEDERQDTAWAREYEYNKPYGQDDKGES